MLPDSLKIPIFWESNDYSKPQVKVTAKSVTVILNLCLLEHSLSYNPVYKPTYAQNGLFTLGKCIDLLPGTCLHMKNVLTCKNSCVSELCKDTCNCKSTTKDSRIESEPGVGLPASGIA